VIFNQLRKSDTHSRILTTQQLAEQLARGASTHSGVSVSPSSALTYAPAFACVRVLAEAVGTLPLHLYARSGKLREKAEAHPLFRLLHFAPNKFQTATEFWQWVVTCLALRGNAYAFINRGVLEREVMELLPLATTAVVPKLEDDGGTVVYDVTHKGGVRKRYPASAILHVKLFSLDGVTGLSPVGWMRETIGMGLAQQEHGARLFKNSARPGGVLSTKKELSVPASKRLIEQVEEIVGGLENAGRTLVLGDGMEWTQIGMSSQDAQWLDARKFTRSEVAGIWRVPPHMIGDLERATFSNIEHQDLAFVKHALMPYLRNIEQRIWMSLLTDEEQKTHYAKFNQDALLRGDAKSRAEALDIEVRNGVRSPNEWRELNDMNPREGGDIYLTPTNMTINGQAPKPGPTGA
jgi:HK97 family phage portal protein